MSQQLKAMLILAVVYLAPDSERTLILRSIRAVFWLRFAEAA